MQFFCVPYERTLQTFGNCLNPTQSIEKHLQSKKSLLYGTNNIVWVQDFPLCNTYYFKGQVLVNIISFQICVRCNLSFPSSSSHVKGTKYYNNPSMSLQEFLHFLFKYSVVLKITIFHYLQGTEKIFLHSHYTIFMCNTLFTQK